MNLQLEWSSSNNLGKRVDQQAGWDRLQIVDRFEAQIIG